MVRAEGDPDGVVVFVAPTKALVNQVAAQVSVQHAPCFPFLPGAACASWAASWVAASCLCILYCRMLHAGSEPAAKQSVFLLGAHVTIWAEAAEREG